MKIKSLLLGSIAAAGFSTGAFAADLNVLTSLDVCDSLGITGLTISSDENCLQISGHVDYEFNWGDYNGGYFVSTGHDNSGDSVEYIANGGAAGAEMDWASSMDAWLKFVGTAESDFGPASVTIKFDYDNDTDVEDEGVAKNSTTANNTGLRIEDAYVSVGDSTVIMAGQKGSIFEKGDDVPLTWLELYNSEAVDHGVDTKITDTLDGGPTDVIQVVADLGNGVSVGAGLENLDGVQNTAATTDDGNFVGYIAYAGDGISAHASLIGGGFLDGTVEDWGIHAGFTGEFDNFNFVAAIAADNNDYWNALASASATFDMFTLAAAVEGINTTAGVSQFGAAVSGSAEVTDGVTLNLGFRWFDEDTSLGATETWQAAIGLTAEVTETVTLTGEVGVVGSNVVGNSDLTYGSVEMAWNPDGGYTSSVKGKVTSTGGYKVTYKAAKSF